MTGFSSVVLSLSLFCSRYSFSDKDTVQEVSLSNAPHSITLNRTEPTDFTGYIMKYGVGGRQA